MLADFCKYRIENEAHLPGCIITEVQLQLAIATGYYISTTIPLFPIHQCPGLPRVRHGPTLAANLLFCLSFHNYRW